MTNLECVVAVLTSHREARKWTDEAVAHDLLAQLGLDATGGAAHAAPVVDPSLVTEAEVVAAETVAKEARAKAMAARNALEAQAEARPLLDGPAVHEVETRHYSDGTSATGVPPLPDHPPEQQAGLVPPAPLLEAEPIPSHG